MILQVTNRNRAVLAAALLALVAAATSTVSAQPCDEFTLVASPNIGSDANVLFGIAGLSADDAWAVGHYRSGSTALPLSMRWNGHDWQTIAMPTPPSGVSGPSVTLYDAHAFGPDDVWAVGSNPPASTGSAALETLVYRWNGSSWSTVPSPIGCCGSFGSQFYSIDGVRGDDFWAVGYKANAVAASPLAAHWNGSSWEEHMLPASTGNINGLKDLHVIASNNIWALEGVGLTQPNTPRRIFHWDGSSWGDGAPPINGILYEAAEAIFAFGPSDVWVSSVRTSSGQIVMLHCNGSVWTEMNVPVFAYEFFGEAPNDLYAVGHGSLMHWNGSTWTMVDSVEGAPMGNIFDAELTPQGVLWCAGNTQPGSESQTLTARFEFCLESVPADLNGDSVVNGIDLGMLLSAWGKCGPALGSCPADLDGNGTVNGFDLAMLLAAWG